MLTKLFGRTKQTTVDIASPLSGEIIGWSDHRSVAASGMRSVDAIAIKPANGQIVAPFYGSVSHIADTGHSITVQHASGLRLKIGIGIHTDELGGDGFMSHVRAGDTFRAGDTLIDFDIDTIVASGYSPITSVVVENAELAKSIEQLVTYGAVSSGHEIILRAELIG
ncbi:PTS sugar transporter subunit IIA [Paenibacillus harenae]|uniref:PTS system glucose-specific IIA component n=1 Tax=Paenibacillus harenae TaxID=306543 RepID=A0ABT9U3T4_PAEHA|nr:PTS glucose transporter subunit IIA [Paenibacillus harenae]MDQ0114301.1 PTS system glucose-specific IIA component [Paenibacillus harenae]